MSQLIRNNAIVDDSWQTLSLLEDETPESVALPAGKTIFPAKVWLARKPEIISRNTPAGLLLQPDDRVEDIAGDLEHFAVIAVNFPKFVDGRGYSTASLLRQRYAYLGELRAVGDVLHDQLFFMKRVGFDSFALKDGKDAGNAIASAFTVFGDAYQGATTQLHPAFRRRA